MEIQVFCKSQKWELLNDVIEKNVKVQYDKCYDIEYEYHINVYEEYVGVKIDDCYMVRLPFGLVRQGFKFADILSFEIIKN